MVFRWSWAIFQDTFLVEIPKDDELVHVLVKCVAEMNYLLNCDFEVQQKEQMVLLFCILSYMIPHLAVSLFGPRTIEETYMHLLYNHLSDQFRIINFRDVSNEEDESRFRLLRYIVQNLTGPHQDKIAEQYITRSICEATVAAEYGSCSSNSDSDATNKAWEKYEIKDTVIPWIFIITSEECKKIDPTFVVSLVVRFCFKTKICVFPKNNISFRNQHNQLHLLFKRKKWYLMMLV